MKQALPLLFAILMVGCAPNSPKTASLKRMTVRTTAYTHSEAGGHSNAIDGALHFGGKDFSAAGGWSWLPLGTRFRMGENGGTYGVEDYGSGLGGRGGERLFLPGMGRG